MIILDFETNTHNPYDVIEVGAIKVAFIDGEYKKIDAFHRYYYSKYDINQRALEVHRLTPQKIKNLRGGENYAKYFIQDNEFIEFCQDCNTLVAHNINFELRYLGNMVTFDNHICTMAQNKHIVRAVDIRGRLKPPKLIEACNHYGIDFDEEQYHSAIYDVTKTLEVLNCMDNLTL
jgi:DNA polymerase-3 subunit epsilon